MLANKLKAALSTLDQCLVSGASFLTVMLGATKLDVANQAILIYVFSCYFGLVLLNIAGYFSVAPVLLTVSEDSKAYVAWLARKQLISAIASSLVIACAFSGALGGGPIPLLVFTFLLSQQLVDFGRRQSYLDGDQASACLQSLLLYVPRIAFIFISSFPSAAEFIAVLAVSSTLICIPTAIKAVKGFSVNSVSRQLVTQHWALSRWCLLGAPLFWVSMHFPVLMVGWLDSPSAAAILGTFRVVVSFANVFIEQLETYVLPWLVKASGFGERRFRSAVRSLILIGLGGWLLGLGGVFLFITFFADSVFADEYLRYKNVLYLLWCGNAAYFGSKVVFIVRRVSGDTLSEFRGYLLGTLVALAGALVLSIDGVWYGALLFAFVQAAMGASLFLGKR